MGQIPSKVKLQSSLSKVDPNLSTVFDRLFSSNDGTETNGTFQTRTLGVVCDLASIAFQAYSQPSDYVKRVPGVQELTKEGTTITHLNETNLRKEMEGVLRIHLQGATNVKDSDRGKSDSYIVFTSAISLAKSEIVNNTTEPIWDSTHYIFVRKHPLTVEKAETLDIDLFDSDTSHENTAWSSLYQAFDEDDHLGHASINLKDLKRPGLKEHEILLSDTKDSSNTSTTIKLSTEFIDIDKFCDGNSDAENIEWFDKIHIRNTEDSWSGLCQQMNLPPSAVNPVAYFDSPSSGSQAWIHVRENIKTVFVAFRGTEFGQLADVLADVSILPESVSQLAQNDFVLKANDLLLDKDTIAHGGFLSAYKSIHETILQTVYSITEWNEDWLVCCVGHSLGGALAVLNAFEIENTKLNNQRGPQVGMLSVGAPRIAGEKFVCSYNSSVKTSVRVVNDLDIVHVIPRTYLHVKEELRILRRGKLVFRRDESCPESPKNNVPVKQMLSKRFLSIRSKQDRFRSLLGAISARTHLQDYYFDLVQRAVTTYSSR